MSWDQIGIPVQAKLIFVAALILGSMGAGYKLSTYQSDLEIAKLTAEWNGKLSEAKDAKLAEEMLARAAERKAAVDIAANARKFEETRQNEKAIADRTITDLRNDVTRLRVSVTRHPGTVVLPGAATSAGECAGQGEATLSGSVAARLAGRYADYNALVTTLEQCQGVVISDREMK